jgi:hypothetical protein
VALIAQTFAARLAADNEPLAKQHAKLKRVRGRGAETQNHLAALMYLRKLEAEMERVCELLEDARAHVESTRNFRSCIRHADHAQQRLHRVIKKLGKRK